MVTVLEMEVVMSAEEVGGKIGTPTPYVEVSSPGQRRTLQNQVSAVSHAAASTSTASPHNQPRAASSSTRDPAGRGDSRKKTLIVVPIACLSPYQTKWTIRARVTKKNNILPWSNLRREGKLFSFEIVDESGEIGVTAFDKEVDKFFSLLETGKMYYISQGKLKEANKKYNTLKNNYEMILLSETSIVPCEDDQDLPMVECDFILIAQLEHMEKDDIIDVIGVCRSVDDLSSFTAKTGRQQYKRDIHLVDTSGKAVAVTLWGEQAEMFDGSVQPIVAVKRARLSDFGGQSVSAIFSSAVMVNPEIPEAHRLRRWYDQEGHALDGQSLTELRPAGGGANTCWKTLSDVKTEQLGQGDKADYFSCVATVLFSGKESCLYQACPSADCKKKVIEQPNGLYHCEKCDKQFPNYKYCVMLSANIADFSDNQWVTCFHETAEGILGHNAETLGQLKDTDEAAFDELFQKVNFTTHIFRNRVKLETYNDESRVKAMVMEVKPVDHREYSRRLISNIRNMAA
ncbi:replication protein A 70 kDa DNA-binding subunit-like isoform X1 [Oncorhynchus nerka]|uniref:replication protein A 70 kDa DNA-binding subunit-like isoform X1 n=1 Tax=Oncorhynchus nerka TaxID=8023 RepID=UPI0031B88043